jgi:hypothetical protein
VVGEVEVELELEVEVEVEVEVVECSAMVCCCCCWCCFSLANIFCARVESWRVTTLGELVAPALPEAAEAEAEPAAEEAEAEAEEAEEEVEEAEPGVEGSALWRGEACGEPSGERKPPAVGGVRGRGELVRWWWGGAWCEWCGEAVLSAAPEAEAEAEAAEAEEKGRDRLLM